MTVLVNIAHIEYTTIMYYTEVSRRLSIGLSLNHQSLESMLLKPANVSKFFTFFFLQIWTPYVNRKDL